MTEASANCDAIVREADYNRYLSALFAPSPARSHLFALYAFNFEVAKTAEMVSNPAIGLIRLEWWREAIGDLYSGDVRGHPVLQALAGAVKTHDLPHKLFDDLIRARWDDASGVSFETAGELEAYADATSGHVMRLAARILGAGGNLDDLAREAGIAYALTGLLRAHPHRASRRNLILPRETIVAAGLGAADAFEYETGPKLASVIAVIADRARTHFEAARARPIRRRYLPAFLPAALVPGYLRVIGRPGLNLFRDSTEMALHRRRFAMLRAMLRGRL